MAKYRILMIIGIWNIVLSFSGFPADTKKILYIITGIVIIFFSYSFRKKRRAKLIREKRSLRFENFGEEDDSSVEMEEEEELSSDPENEPEEDRGIEISVMSEEEKPTPRRRIRRKEVLNLKDEV
ncbi:hypothetical protein KC842_00680 [Candidatus Nomurabacteria bacterium]|nr:hypothetical protein [Candidatus Nomurabacteria bacterium]USN94915.1 MAG: hypothetical protein H6791_00605 [Candidatus Nomurabacteria bacterium]